MEWGSGSTHIVIQSRRKAGGKVLLSGEKEEQGFAASTFLPREKRYPLPEEGERRWKKRSSNFTRNVSLGKRKRKRALG